MEVVVCNLAGGCAQLASAPRGFLGQFKSVGALNKEITFI